MDKWHFVLGTSDTFNLRKKRRIYQGAADSKLRLGKRCEQDLHRTEFINWQDMLIEWLLSQLPLLSSIKKKKKNYELLVRSQK